MLKRTVSVLVAALAVVSACSGSGRRSQVPSTDEKAIEAWLQKLTLREKVGQLFNTRPESICPEFAASGQGMVTYALQEVTEGMKEFCKEYPVGGITLFAHNIDNPEQLCAFTAALHELPGHPLLAIDEEGGRVARIGNNRNFDVFRAGPASEMGATGRPENAYDMGKAIGTYLKQYGFDMDFAPVADVNTNPENIVIGNRAFSDQPEKAAPMVVKYLQGLESTGIVGCLKHFPGHGDTKGDTHTGYVQTEKTWEEISRCEMVTFREGIKAGARMVMIAHIATPGVTGNNLPATLSPVIIEEKLRGELGFDGVIITDAMGMGAISQHYSSAESAVKCLQAGADIILMPANFKEAFEAVIRAVENGEITEERIDRSVRRILRLKNTKN